MLYSEMCHRLCFWSSLSRNFKPPDGIGGYRIRADRNHRCSGHSLRHRPRLRFRWTQLDHDTASTKMHSDL